MKRHVHVRPKHQVCVLDVLETWLVMHETEVPGCYLTFIRLMLFVSLDYGKAVEAQNASLRSSCVHEAPDTCTILGINRSEMAGKCIISTFCFEFTAAVRRRALHNPGSCSGQM